MQANPLMPDKILTAALIAAAIAVSGVLPANAQTLVQSASKQPTPAAQTTPYKALAITLPGDMTDAGLTALRNQLSEAARKRDAATVAKLVVGGGFFWERDKGDAASKRRSGYENLSAALGLGSKDSVGWDMLTGYADDPGTSPSPGHKGAFCTPADPGYDVAAFDKLLKATQTQASEWGYPVSAGIDVRATAASTAPAIDKLGLHFVRIMPDSKPGPAAFQRVVTPAGKIGFVSIDVIIPFGNDQICYVKDGGTWKIGGYIGGGEPQ
jgi:hypothetical protein